MTEQIYIAAGTGTAGYIESIDGKYPSADIFQKTNLTDSFGRKKTCDVYFIDTKAEGFEKFKEDLIKAYARYREKSAENPTEAAMINVLHHLENPGVFQVVLPAGPTMTEWLQGVFGDIAKIGDKYSGTNLNKITLRFDKNSLSERDISALRNFHEQMSGVIKNHQDLIDKYGTGYLNLYLFAKSVVEQEDQIQLQPWSDVLPLLPDEPEAMYCSAETGAVPEINTTLLGPDQQTEISISFGSRDYPEGRDKQLGLMIHEGEGKSSIKAIGKPILVHYGEDQSDMKDTIYMPLRKTHFYKNEFKPKGDFKGTIAEMVDDLYEITSGDFAKTCGVHRLRDFDGELTVYFVGMADPIGDKQKNQKLSEDRARVIAKEFARQLRKRNTTDPLKTKHGVRVVYAGVGEQGDKEVNPELRQTRVLIMSSGIPDYWVEEWKEVKDGRIAGDPSLRGIQLEDHCIGQPEGCEELLADCIESAKLLCSQMPYHDQQACEERLTNHVWTAEDIRAMDPQMAYWLLSFYGRPFGLRYFHNIETGNGLGAHGSSHLSSLQQCFRESRDSLRYGGLHYPRKWKLHTPNITREIPLDELGSLPLPDLYCTERTAAVDAKGCRLSREPRNYVVRCGTKKVATFGQDHISLIYEDDSFFSFLWRNDRIIHFPAFRSFIVNEDGVTTNFHEIMNQIRNDVLSAINGGRFFKRCYDKKVTKLKINLYSAGNPFSSGNEHKIEEQKDYIIEEVKKRLRREFGRRVELSFEKSSLHNNGSFVPNHSVNVSVGAAIEGETYTIDGWDFIFSYGGYARQAGGITGGAGQVRVETPDN